MRTPVSLTGSWFKKKKDIFGQFERYLWQGLPSVAESLPPFCLGAFRGVYYVAINRSW